MTTLAQQKKEVTQASRHFFSGTILSRVLGLTRDIAMAYTFGSHAVLAALMVAFRLSNLLRRLFGEGALHAAFVPVYEKIRARSEKEGALFFLDLSLLLGFVLLTLILGTEGVLYILLKKGHLSSGNFQILSLTTLLLPSTLFICHAAFCSSFLQCQKHYFLPAISPVFFNLFWIMGLLWARRFPITQGVTHLAVFIFLGLIFQWLVLFPKSFRLLKKQLEGPPSLNLKRAQKGYKRLGKPFLLGVLGVSATQVNSALDALFARAVDLKGPAYLWYALRIEQVPLAIFGVALAGALLPTLSRAYLQNREKFNELLDYSLARALGLLVPCMSALFFIGPATLNLLFARGHFGTATAIQTTTCLWAYSAGLGFQGLSLILASAFYAQQNYKITTLATFYSMLLNVLLNFIFAFYFKWGAWGIALATSLSASFQVLFLLTTLLKSISSLKLNQFKRAALRVGLVSLLAGGLMYLVCIYFNPIGARRELLSFPRGLNNQILNFTYQVGIFLIGLFSLSWILKVKEILSLLEYLPLLKRKKG